MRGLTNGELKALLRSVGTHRGDRPLSPVEVAEHLQKAINAGATRQACGSAINIGASQVSTFLRLVKLSPRIRHLAVWGATADDAIAFSSLAELARLSEADQTAAAKAMLEHKLTWKEAIQLVQIASRSGRLIEECIASVIKLRPEVERRYVLMGAISSPELQKQLSALSQGARDDLLRKVLITLYGEREQVHGRLGVKHFSLIGARQPYEPLGLTADQFESLLNSELFSASRHDDPHS